MQYRQSTSVNQRNNSNSNASSNSSTNTNIQKEVDDILGPSWFDAEADYRRRRTTTTTDYNNNSNHKNTNSSSSNSITRVLFVAIFEDKEELQEHKQHSLNINDNNAASSSRKKLMNDIRINSPINEFIQELKSPLSSTTFSSPSSDFPINDDNDIITGGLVLLTTNSSTTTDKRTTFSSSSNQNFKVTSPIPTLGFIESSPCRVYNILHQIDGNNHHNKESNHNHLFHSIRILSITEDCPTREYESDFELYVAPSKSSTTTTTVNNNNDDQDNDNKCNNNNDDNDDDVNYVNELIKSEGGPLNVATNIFTMLCSNEGKELLSKSQIQKYDSAINTELICKVLIGPTLLRKVIPSISIIEACTKFKGYTTVNEFLDLFESSIFVDLEGTTSGRVYPPLPIIDFDQIL